MGITAFKAILIWLFVLVFNVRSKIGEVLLTSEGLLCYVPVKIHIKNNYFSDEMSLLLVTRSWFHYNASRQHEG